MNVLSARDRARQVLAQELVDTCRVSRPDPSPFDLPVDPQTHQIAPADAYAHVVYEGPAHVMERLRHTTAQKGTEDLDYKTWFVRLPATCPVIVERDVVTFTASQNPQVVGIPLLVQEIHRDSYEVFRTLIVVDSTGALERA